MLLLLAACTSLPEVVTMSGTVLDAPEGLGNPVEGATVATFDDVGAAYAEAATDAEGAFAVEVAAGQIFYLTVAADGLVPTSFNGVAGIDDFAATAGYPWVAQDSFVDEVRAAHDACATVAEEGAIVTGEVRWYVAGASNANLPPAEDVEVLAKGQDGVVRTACYHDADGASLADGTLTSSDGVFAVFGMPAGGAIVQAWHEDSGGNEVFAEYTFVVPEDGLVPMYPLTL